MYKNLLSSTASYCRFLLIRSIIINCILLSMKSHVEWLQIFSPFSFQLFEDPWLILNLDWTPPTTHPPKQKQEKGLNWSDKLWLKLVPCFFSYKISATLIGIEGSSCLRSSLLAFMGYFRTKCKFFRALFLNLHFFSVRVVYVKWLMECLCWINCQWMGSNPILIIWINPAVLG